MKKSDHDEVVDQGMCLATGDPMRNSGSKCKAVCCVSH